MVDPRIQRFGSGFGQNGIDLEDRCDDAPIALRRPAGGLRNGAARRGAREDEERGC